MKTLKLLFAVLVITTITSMHGVFAYSYNVYSIVNRDVPGFNGSYTTPTRTLDTSLMGAHHFMKNVDVERNLDIRLVKTSTSPDTYGSWQLLSDGKTTQLTNSLSPVTLYMQGGDFNLYIDSSWIYTSATTIYNADWKLES